MTMHFLLSSAGLLIGAVVLLGLGGLGEIEIATLGQCNGYFCQPQIIDIQPKPGDAALTRKDERLGLR